MTLLTINGYLDTLNNPDGLFRSLTGFTVRRDLYGACEIRSGNNSVVFRLDFGSRPFMLKCYTRHKRPSPALYDYVARSRSPLLTPARILPQEIWVFDHNGGGSWHDVVFAPWVEGRHLSTHLHEALRRNDREALARLARSFDRMALHLLGEEFAHGDLKPDNLIVTPAGEMKPVDYDALFIPSLAGTYAAETGTPGYNHPARDARLFDKHIDDYAVALLSVTLHALSLDPGMYDRYCTGGTLFCPPQIVAGHSPALEHARSLFAGRGMHAQLRLCRLLESESPALPGLGAVLEQLVPERKPSYSDGDLLLTERNGLWGYADRQGRTVIEPVFSRAGEFSEGLAAVVLHGCRHYIDTTGQVAINGSRYSSLKSFSEGMAAVCRDGAWGYIDRNGREVIVPAFVTALSFHEGMAAVETGQGWGYIGQSGLLRIDARFDRARSFRDGTATVEKEGRIMKIDIFGEIV